MINGPFTHLIFGVFIDLKHVSWQFVCLKALAINIQWKMDMSKYTSLYRKVCYMSMPLLSLKHATPSLLICTVTFTGYASVVGPTGLLLHCPIFFLCASLVVADFYFSLSSLWLQSFKYEFRHPGRTSWLKSMCYADTSELKQSSFSRLILLCADLYGANCCFSHLHYLGNRRKSPE